MKDETKCDKRACNECGFRVAECVDPRMKGLRIEVCKECRDEILNRLRAADAGKDGTNEK